MTMRLLALATAGISFLSAFFMLLGGFASHWNLMNRKEFIKAVSFCSMSVFLLHPHQLQ